MLKQDIGFSCSFPPIGLPEVLVVTGLRSFGYDPEPPARLDEN